VRISRPAHLALVLAAVLATSVISSPVVAAGASLQIEPASVAVAGGASFSVNVVQGAPAATSGAQVSINFDPTILQVVSVSRGAAYATAPIFLPLDMAADIHAANATGHLAQIAAAFTPPDAVPAGTASFLVVRFRVAGCGQTDLGLPASGPFNAQMISGEKEVYGRQVPVVTSNGHVTTCVGADAVTAGLTNRGTGGTAGASSPIGLIGAVVVIAVVLLAGLAWRMRRREQLDDVEW
jgi:hypothetical protein